MDSDWTIRFDGESYTMTSGGKGRYKIAVAVGEGEMWLKGTISGPYYETPAGAVSFKPFPDVKGKLSELGPSGKVVRGSPGLFTGIAAPTFEMDGTCEGDSVTLTGGDRTIKLGR